MNISFVIETRGVEELAGVFERWEYSGPDRIVWATFIHGSIKQDHHQTDVHPFPGNVDKYGTGSPKRVELDGNPGP